MRAPTVVLLVLLFQTSAAHADELKPFQTQAKQDAERGIKDALKYAERFCGAPLTATFDFAAYTQEVDAAWKGYGKGAGCAAVIEAIGYTCSGLQYPAYADAAKKHVKGVRCTFEGKEQKAIKLVYTVEGLAPNLSFDKKTGVFTYHMAMGHKNVKELAAEYLRKELDK